MDEIENNKPKEVEIKKITIEDVKNDDKLLQRILNHYNVYYKFKEKNREKYNEYARNYYYKSNNIQPKKKNTEEYKKEYQRQYRQKLKEKRELMKQQKSSDELTS